MVFLDAVRETPYDLWIGDEAWEVDHFLHENPELKTAPFVFMTDFLGWLPIDDAPGSREAFLTADYNAEMIEHIERFPYIRDRAIYFGEYDDLVPDRFGPDLPLIRDWAREHMTAVGYVVPVDPADYSNTSAVRERLGYDPQQPLMIAAVGGTAVGKHLLDKVVAAWPLIRRERPELRGVVVTGPRIDSTVIPEQPGLEIRPYVHNLYEHLAVADLGIVQGGLSTTMELAVNRRPFLYFPLRDHCEQVLHVAHRLDRYSAGVRLDYDATTAESLADAALDALGSDTSNYRPHQPGAAARTAALIAELLHGRS
jgi:predicted glycosyltransferase